MGIWDQGLTWKGSWSDLLQEPFMFLHTTLKQWDQVCKDSFLTFLTCSSQGRESDYSISLAISIHSGRIISRVMVLGPYGDPPAQMAFVTSFRQHLEKRMERQEIKTWFGVLSFVEKWEDQLQTLCYLQSVLVLTSRLIWNPPADRCIFQGTCSVSWISWKRMVFPIPYSTLYQ